METVRDVLAAEFSKALEAELGPEAAGLDPQLAPTRDSRFGDYQCNAAMATGKRFGRKPRDLANSLVEKVEPTLEGVVEKLEVAGPGFINIKLQDEWLANRVDSHDPGHWDQTQPQKVVIDYSSPNVAKEMHVGHLRSTILGDAIARILQFQGHEVVRQNHLGDWGTQFGMLGAYLKETNRQSLEELASIEELYREANAKFHEDEQFQERARAEVVALHNGDAQALETWKTILEQSRKHYESNYQRLKVLLRREDERGESFYNDRLPAVVADLEKRFGPDQNNASIEVRESEGALCVYHKKEDGSPLFLTKEDEPQPFIIRKSDGAFLYATTDLAALRYRIEDLEADRLIYVTDNRQTFHFEQLFATARGAGLTRRNGQEIVLEHVTFGKMLSPNRKPLKTREGGNVRLSALLDEAVERAAEKIQELESERAPDKRNNFSPEEIQEIGQVVGIGAVKYSDLAQNRQTDYIFTWDKLLDLKGNTAPYLMYAYSRIRSIFRDTEAKAGPVTLKEQAERDLALTLLRFPEAVQAACDGWKVNSLADYLYHLATLFHKFYDQCHVLGSDQQASRLTLCERTATTLKIGLSLLGIEVTERM